MEARSSQHFEPAGGRRGWHGHASLYLVDQQLRQLRHLRPWEGEVGLGYFVVALHPVIPIELTLCTRVSGPVGLEVGHGLLSGGWCCSPVIG